MNDAAERPSRAPLVVGALLVAALGAFVALKLRVTTDVTLFLAAGGEARRAKLTRDLADSELTRALILTLEPASAAPDPAGAAQAGLALEQALRDDEAVARVRGGAQDLERPLFELCFPRRFALASTRPEQELPARLTDAGLAAAARELMRHMELPTAPLVKRLAPEDPLRLFAALLARLEAAAEGALRVHEGRLLTADGRAAVLFVETRASPFDTAAAAPFLERLDAHVARIAREQGRALKLERSGAHPFALSTERSIKADVVRVSVVSTLGVVLLFVLVFRSLRAVLLLLLPILLGLLAATAAGLAVFGQLHGLTLAFGATLIGVCDDYPIHLLVRHALVRGAPLASLRAVWPGLRVAALSSVVGLAALAFTSLPGLREVAVFTSTGVLTALLATRWLLPPLLPAEPRPGLTSAAAGAAARAFGWLRARPRLALLPAVAAAAVVAAGLPRVRWVDDPAALHPLDPDLRAEEERVRRRVGRVDGGRLVVARGPDAETALRRGEAAAARLDALVAAGSLRAHRGLRDLVPSADVQSRCLALFRADPALPDRLLAALRSERFRAERFAPAVEALRAPPPPPLTLAEVSASPLADLVRPFHATLDGEPAVLLHLVGADLPAVEAALAGLPGVDVFDQRAWVARAYGEGRARTLTLVAAGVVAIVLLLAWRHRSAAKTATAVGPALLATAATLGAFGLAGADVHIMHLVSLLLVLSLGEDYGVFLAEVHDAADDEVAGTLLVIALSCATTVLSFGLLALSTSPALRAIGLTVGLGMAFSLLLSPAALALSRGR